MTQGLVLADALLFRGRAVLFQRVDDFWLIKSINALANSG